MQTPKLFPEEQRTNNFKQAQQLINQGRKQVCNPGTNCTMMLGMTRSGKSTFINYLLGTPLKADVMDANGKGTKSRTLKVMLANPDLEEFGPKIGHSIKSQTTIPKKYQSNNGAFKQVLFDNPGFGDNRGVAIDISNAALVSQLLSKAKDLRFVLVVDIENITGDNRSIFVTLIKQINYLLDVEIIKNHTCIVFTKVKEDFQKQDILQDLKSIVEDITDPEFNKELIEYIIKQERISIFPKPTKKGPIEMEYADQITQAIMNIKPYPKISKVKVGISPQTKNYIYQNHQIILQYIKKDLENLLNYLDKLIDIQKIPNIFELQQIQMKLNEATNKIAINKRDANMKDFIQRMSHVINQYGIQIPNQLTDSINTKLYLIEFIKKIIQLKTMQIDEFKNDSSVKIKKIMQKLMTKGYELQYKQAKINKQQMEKIKKQQQKNQQQFLQQMKNLNAAMRQQQKKHAEQLKRISEDTSQLKQAAIRQEQQMLQLRRINQIQRNKSWLKKLLESMSMSNAGKQFIS